MKLAEIVQKQAIVFLDSETEILIAWNGQICFEVFAGKFDGNYDLIDSFYQEIKSLAAAQEVAKMWFQQHGTFNPGP